MIITTQNWFENKISISFNFSRHSTTKKNPQLDDGQKSYNLSCFKLMENDNRKNS